MWAWPGPAHMHMHGQVHVHVTLQFKLRYYIIFAPAADIAIDATARSSGMLGFQYLPSVQLQSACANIIYTLISAHELEARARRAAAGIYIDIAIDANHIRSRLIDRCHVTKF